MRFTKQPHTEPIPGYRLLEPMGSGGFGEVWKCEAPGGLLKAIKFVHGDPNGLGVGRAPAEEELAAIQRVKAIRHPFLLSMERVESVDGELVIVLELADKNLHDRLRECVAAGLAGIAREELLAYLTETAEALDLMNIQHNLQHLDIKPHNLFLVGNHVKVGDFGLVHSLGGRAGDKLDSLSVTPLYASPETFLGQVSQHSDQYALAIVYQELLTQRLPFRGKNARQLLMLHTQGEPDLHVLPERDRPAIAKALAKDPKARFPSCSHLVRALVTGWIPNQLAVVARGAADRPASPIPELAERLHTAAALETISDTALTGADLQPVLNPDQARTATPTPTSANSCTTLKGYVLQQRLRSGPLSEVWQAQTPDGSWHLVTQVFGWNCPRGDALDQLLARWRALQHPVLPVPRVLHAEPGRLIYATPFARRTLREHLQELRSEHEPEAARAGLLRQLSNAAAALDQLYQTHQIAHLGLTPRQMIVEQGTIVLSDFGLAQLFWLPSLAPWEFLNERYTAPELRRGQISSFCDQYSLAKILGEVLTACAASRSKTPTRPGDLDELAEADRAVLARALDPDPARRWPSCTELVRALGGPAPVDPGMLSCLDLFLDDSAAQPPARSEPIRCPEPARGEVALHGRFTANLPAETMAQRFEGFRRQWDAEVIRADDSFRIFQVSMLGSLWQQSTGQEPKLKVQVQLRRLPTLSGAGTEVAVKIRPLDCGAEQGAQFLQEMGNLLFESLQAHLHAVPQRRAEERLPWHYTLQLQLLDADGEPGETLECQGKDISLNGIGFYAPREVSSTQAKLILPATPQTPRVTTVANIVRVQRCGAGWYEVGAVLLAPAPHEEVRAASAQANSALPAAV